MQSKININNYEAFLLDYMEGNLSKEDMFELQVFAAQHPHLNIDLNDLELVELTIEEIRFENKENLKKVEISEEHFVAYVENALSQEEKQNLETLCASDEKLNRDLKLYKHTILAADASIIFENKNKLKKQETKVLWLFKREVLAAAASLVLLFSIWVIFRNFNSVNETLSSQKINGVNRSKAITLNKNTSASTPTFTVKKETNDRVNTNLVAKSDRTVQVTPNDENESLIVNNTPKVEKDNAPKEITPVIKKDEDVNKEPVKLAVNTAAPTNSTTSKPYVIVEKAYDEDEVVASNQKKGFWGKAMKALSGLNKIGVKRVNGTETTQPNNEQYVLSMGNFSVENKRYNAE